MTLQRAKKPAGLKRLVGAWRPTKFFRAEVCLIFTLFFVQNIFRLVCRSDMLSEPKKFPHDPRDNFSGFLKKYKYTARKLYELGYYKGLIQAIESCIANVNTFLIIDCPSGTGKSLAGVALSLLDYRENPEASIGGAPVAVVHLVWPKAVCKQPIYEDIVKQSGVNDRFFRRASAFNYKALNTIEDQSMREQYVRKNLLDAVYSGTDAKECSQNPLILIIDEVPEDPVEVTRIGEIREALKIVHNLCLVLCGTNSKAANMVGLSQGVATSENDSDPSLWAMIVTRLPKFVLNLSFVAKYWHEMNQPQYKMFSEILDVIKCSISNGGNPRLIVYAIQAAFQEFQLQKKIPANSRISEPNLNAFYTWQSIFSSKVLLDKFASTSFTRSYKGLVGQLNLLLEATATADLSDVLLGHHFAYRVIPDNSASASSDIDADFGDCGGCLYLGRQRSRAVGLNLCFVRGYPVQPVNVAYSAFYAWQTTRFSPPHADILLYLMACRGQGYLTVVVADESAFRAYEVVSPSWRSNAAGLVNFQNPRAVVNSGSLLEVLTSAAVSNAAGRARIEHDFLSFIAEFGEELGLKFFRTKQFTDDPILTKLVVPKFIFPGTHLLLSKSRYLRNLGGVLGTAERQANNEGFDLLVQAIGSSPADSIRFEAKDREQFGTSELIEAAVKIMRGASNVGVLVVRNCNLYWGNRKVNINNREVLALNLAFISNLGKAYLVSSFGDVVTLVINEDSRAAGRLILLQVPESSLGETL
jgi:hypothetical protein